MRRIETLNENQVFVFGSNENGYHAGGAARQALDRFGAVWGKAKGLQGQSYAIVTLDEDMRQVPPSYILEQLTELNEFAGRNPDKEFLMTLIGCGIAGFWVEDIRDLCRLVRWHSNVKLPEEFV